VNCVHTDGKKTCSQPTEWGDLRLLGRLKPGISPAAAEAQLTALGPQFVSAQVARERRSDAAPQRYSVVPEVEGRHEEHLPQVRTMSALALGASAIVWLVACGNVANLLLARATRRQHEMAIRLSLGASRWRVARQLLTENALLAMLAGGVAVAFTFWTAGYLSAAIPADVQLPLVLDFNPDVRVLGWTFALSLVTALVFGAAPIQQAMRTSLIPALKPNESGSSKGARRLTIRNALVVGQIALSVVVLAGGGLFLKSLANARAAFKPAFDADRLVSMRLDSTPLGYQSPRLDTLYRDILRQATLLSGVEGVSLVSSPPFGPAMGEAAAWVFEDGGSAPAPDQNSTTSVQSVGPGYFQTMGVPLVAGRDFDERDDVKTTAVTILNRTVARSLFGTEQAALGKRVRVRLDDRTLPPLEVVGVIDVPRSGPGTPLWRVVYQPSRQRAPTPAMTLVVRAVSPGDMKSVADAVRRTVQQIDPRLPILDLRVGEDHADPKLGTMRLAAGISMTLGVVALALAGMGLYGVMAYAVGMRTREIGIRVALGAERTNLRMLVIRQGMLLTLIGLAIGFGGALLATPVIAAVLFAVSSVDPATFVAIAGILAAIALVACYLPARRATRIDPTVALRCE
jgi:putative ABC transport system permease protein